MLVKRKELLAKLTAVSCGIHKRDTVEQSSCIVFKRGRLYTYSPEVSCSLISGFPTTVEGAIRADYLIPLFKELPDIEVEVSIADRVFSLKGRNKRARLPMETEILLPIDSVERPERKVPLSSKFSEAIELVQSCTKKRSNFLMECIYVDPLFVQASDNTQLARWRVKTFVQSPVLVRAESLKVVIPLGMTDAAETKEWLHFYSPMGMRLSVRKWVMKDYPDFEPTLAMRGNKVLLPKGLIDIVKRASVFDDNIFVAVNKGVVTVTSTGPSGEEYIEKKAVAYSGPKMAFCIAAKLISKVIERQNEVELTDSLIRVDGANFVWCGSLGSNQ